ncbi:MAG: hypothetical protein GC200_05070 [Tepidisphaera sp.]|nr:hypothetical protein [Tepidisphaera sp.]
MRFKKILVAVDGATAGTDVLPTAAELARCTGAELALITVADVRGIGVSEVSPPAHAAAAMLREEAARLLQGAAAELAADAKPLMIVREGLPEKELAAAARDWHADVLVMGTHARTGLAHIFHASVAESVLHHSPCPVLLLRIGQPA